jgi:hypothetical protein
MECQKCPIIEECNNIQESIKKRNLAKVTSAIKMKFCPLVFAAMKTTDDVNF